MFDRVAATGGVDIDNMKKQLKIMQDELTKNVMKTNAADNLKKSMDSKINSYKDQIAKLEAAQVRLIDLTSCHSQSASEGTMVWTS